MSIVETICAISTAPGVGGIAVIRVSGPEAFPITDKVLSQDLMSQAAMTVSYGWLQQAGQEIDEVLVSKFAAPRSFTGEDVVEISVHGSIFIQQEALRVLTQNGARLATHGEFTKRAFLNGKMDLSQAEAVADLIASESAASHRLALQQMRGGFSDEIAELRNKLIEFAALMELELDFSEEDVEFADRSEFRKLINTILERIGYLRDSFVLGNVLKNGIPVAILGAPNSGKSTLLNALLQEDRAIVSEIAGTTRDTIEDTVQIEGISFRFIDTAGVRATTDVIESKGIDRALQKAKSASIVIRLMDGREITADEEVRLYDDYIRHVGWEDDERTLRVINKDDVLASDAELPPFDLRISALHGEGIDRLREMLLERVHDLHGQASDVIVSNARHVEALSRVDESLRTVLSAMDQGLPSDLLAIDIRKALHYLGEVTGEVTTDDLLGTIFSRFCIGK